MKQLTICQRNTPATNLPLFNQINPVLARIYASRGLHDLNDLGRNLKALLPDGEMRGVDGAVDRLVKAVRLQERVLIVGDFDCDGATSTSVALLALRQMGLHHVDYLVPNRFDYGYGLSPEIVDVALERQPQLLITVDNGISSISGVKRPQSMAST